MEMIALDCQKHYSVAAVQTPEGHCLAERRLEHRRGSICAFLEPYSCGCPVAVETIGNWYWIVDEIEQAGKIPWLVHARKAKLMLGALNKTDKLDVRGLNRLQQAGTLPTVWIPPALLRDQRELPRTRRPPMPWPSIASIWRSVTSVSCTAGFASGGAMPRPWGRWPGI